VGSGICSLVAAVLKIAQNRWESNGTTGLNPPPPIKGNPEKASSSLFKASIDGTVAWNSKVIHARFRSRLH